MQWVRCSQFGAAWHQIEAHDNVATGFHGDRSLRGMVPTEAAPGRHTHRVGLAMKRDLGAGFSTRNKRISYMNIVISHAPRLVSAAG